MTSPLTTFSFFYEITQVDSMLPCVCTAIDERGRQNWWEHHWHIPQHLVCQLFVRQCYILTAQGHLVLSNRTATWNSFVHLSETIDTMTIIKTPKNGQWDYFIAVSFIEATFRYWAQEQAGEGALFLWSLWSFLALAFSLCLASNAVNNPIRYNF